VHVARHGDKLLRAATVRVIRLNSSSKRPASREGNREDDQPRIATAHAYREDQIMAFWLPDLLEEKGPDGKRFTGGGLGSWAMKDVTLTLALKAIAKRKRKVWRRNAADPWHPPCVTTIERELNVLSGIWRYAIGLKEITGVTENVWRDPHIREMVGKDRRTRDERDKAMMVLSEEEIEKVRAVLQAEHHPRWQRWFEFMLPVGPRISGAKQIDPSQDIDYDAGEPRAVWITQKTKGLHKRRVKVPLLFASARQAVKEQLAAEGTLWVKDDSRYREVLYTACRKAEIPLRSPHSAAGC
jgi:hypothetical protein